MNYFKILVFLQKGDHNEFDMPVEKQRDYLAEFDEPENDIDRSYYQYLCQNFYVLKWKIILFNLIGALFFPLILMYYLTKRLWVKKGEVIFAMIENKGMDEVVPIIVRDKYKPSTLGYNEGASISISDLSFLGNLIMRAPYHPYFVFKSMMNVARYSDMIKRHQPQVMIQFGEFSFSSSLLTAYCHKHGAVHVNIMHGEKIYSLRDTFFHYDECYVWSEFYIELFRKLRAVPSQFIIALPPSMRIECDKFQNPSVYADYKYYLDLYDEEEIQSIVSSLSFVKRAGKSLKFRPHPRYSNVALLKKYVSEDEIEYPCEVPILESISNTDYVIGIYTTVLVQAYFSGKKVIMDDITNKVLYDKSKALNYFLADRISDNLSMHQSS